MFGHIARPRTILAAIELAKEDARKSPNDAIKAEARRRIECLQDIYAHPNKARIWQNFYKELHTEVRDGTKRYGHRGYSNAAA